MRIASFIYKGRERWGIVEGSAVLDLSAVLGGKFPDVRQVLRTIGLEGLARLPEVSEAPSIPLTEVNWLPPVRPEKILCVGLNYSDHVEETRNVLPPYPAVFARFNESLVGHGDALVRPLVSEQFDYEGELAVVIGKPGRHLQEDQVPGHIAGYCCFNDGSVRDWQKQSVTAGKNFHRSGAFGPAIVTPDEVGDPDALTLVTRVNGLEVQRAATGTMIYDIRRVISYISTFVRLMPGDVIATGTPSGVGARRDPPLWLKPGDCVEVEIERVGVLCNPVVDE